MKCRRGAFRVKYSSSIRVLVSQINISAKLALSIRSGCNYVEYMMPENFISQNRVT